MKKILNLFLSFFVVLGLSSCSNNIDYEQYIEHMSDVRANNTLKSEKVERVIDNNLIIVDNQTKSRFSSNAIDGSVKPISIDGMSGFYASVDDDKVIFDKYLNEINLLDSYKEYVVDSVYFLPISMDSKLFRDIFKFTATKKITFLTIKEFLSPHDSFRLYSDTLYGTYKYSKDLDEEEISSMNKLDADYNLASPFFTDNSLIFESNDKIAYLSNGGTNDFNVTISINEKNDFDKKLNNGFKIGDYLYYFDLKEVKEITNKFDVMIDNKRYVMDYKRYNLFNLVEESVKLNLVFNNSLIRGNDGSAIIFGNKIYKKQLTPEYYYAIIKADGSIGKIYKNVDKLVENTIYSTSNAKIAKNYDEILMADNSILVGLKDGNYYYKDIFLGKASELGSFIPNTISGEKNIFFYNQTSNILFEFNSNGRLTQYNNIRMLDLSIGLYVDDKNRVMVLGNFVAKADRPMDVRVYDENITTYNYENITSTIIQVQNEFYNIKLTKPIIIG